MINAVKSKHSFPIVIDYIDKLPSSVFADFTQKLWEALSMSLSPTYGLDSEV